MDNNERTGYSGIILKTMKKWNKSIRVDDITKKPKIGLKLEKIKSDELYEKVFLKNAAHNSKLYNEVLEEN